ncbi:MAG: DUF2585 family protein [Planctomycetaceae bacterium]|nr:DUF2585 family protein [Planctomycetaceae bacterium]
MHQGIPCRRDELKQMLVGTIIVCTVVCAVLLLMGQPAWCKCGRPVPWSWDIWTSHNSQHFVDPYTLTHVLHGIAFCGLIVLLPQRVSWLVRYMIALTIEAGWEVLENTPFIINRYREATISLDYLGDSTANSCVDILACGAGFLLARQIGFRWSTGLFVATELFLLLTIRDSLLLNILMLIHPLDSVREWQMP